MDAGMVKVAAASGVPLILMHMLGTPKTMQVSPVYEDLLSDISAFLAAAIDQAVTHGVLRSRIIIDPGIGFGKTIRDNLTLIRCMNTFASLDTPILIGPSRKSFIRNLLKAADPKGLDPDADSMEIGTQAIVAAGILNGAHILRVHDVAQTLTTVKIMDAMKEIPDASCH